VGKGGERDWEGGVRRKEMSTTSGAARAAALRLNPPRAPLTAGQPQAPSRLSRHLPRYHRSRFTPAP